MRRKLSIWSFGGTFLSALINVAGVLLFVGAARAEAYYLFEQRSDPQGILSSSGSYPAGSRLSTANAALFSTGYYFAYWTVGGERVADALGQSRTQADFLLVVDTLAVATYLLPSVDADADGIPDYVEWRCYLSLTNGVDSDVDGDGFSHSEEISRGYTPAVYDDLRDGGVMMRLSDVAVVRNEAVKKRYEIRSEPQGIVSLQTGHVNAGTLVSTPTIASGATSGYYFGHWEVNGVRQASGSGLALPQAVLTMTNDVVAIARFYAAGDGDGDGLQDWREYYWFGELTQNLFSDPDGDGLSISNELDRGYEVHVCDDLRDGGLMMRVSDVAVVRNEAVKKRYEIRSEPQGIVSLQTGYVNAGTLVSTPAIASGLTSGYYFGYWEVNGVRQAAGSGMALPQAVLTMTNDVVAVARFYAAGDSDGDGLEDWREQYWFGNLANSLLSDPDGDGLSISNELERGYEVHVHDDLRDGGLMMRLSDSAVVRNEAVKKRYEIRSDPQGILSLQVGYTNVGSLVYTPTVAAGATSGYYFGFWEVDGVRQAAGSGLALPQAVLTMTNDVVAVARFFAGGDSDGDSLEDWREQYWFGALSNDLQSDPDGDGLSISNELDRGYEVNVYDDLRDGGIMMRLSGQQRLSIEYLPRVTEVLVNGLIQAGFEESGGKTGVLSVARNSAPALGDWDGDLDTDLIVGGGNGSLRFFRNDGSPSVINYVEAACSNDWVAAACAAAGDVMPALGDWTGDGQADLAIGGATDVVSLVSSQGGWAPGSQGRIVYSLPVAGAVRTVPAFGDYDGDVWPDLFLLRDDGTVEVYAHTGSTGAPYFGPATVTNLLDEAVASATGLAVGDLNGDGLADILVSDFEGRIWEFRRNVAGAYPLRSRGYGGTYPGFAERLTVASGDMDGDGDVDVVAGFAEGGLIFMRNQTAKLAVSPPSETVLGGASVAFTVQGVASGVAWRLARNASGASLGSSTGIYIAGPTNGTLDVVEAVHTNSGVKGLAYVNVIGEEDLSRAGKAIVIAGRKSVSDPLWPTTDYLADSCYKTLLYRAFSKDNIHYLSPEPEQDADNNGAKDDIAGYASLANVANAFTNWSARSGPLFVYLVDHGGDVGGAGQFRLNPDETLTAAQLDVWLDAMQDRYTNDVVVVVDCCESGSFLDELTYGGPARRTVITACSADEPTYFVSGGLVSFSDAFFAGILMGLDLGRAFAYARDAMSAYQAALLDADHSGTYEVGTDETGAADIYVGASFVAGKDIPQIGSVCGAQTLSGSAKAMLWAANVASAYPIDRVWCLVVPPGHQPSPDDPVGDLPVLPLAFNPDTRRYEAEYAGFSQSGTFKILCYARDIWGSVSLPRQTYVLQNGCKERVILVAGGTTNNAAWLGVDAMARKAYHTFRSRWLEPSAIYYLSPLAWQDVDGDATNDVDAASASNSLAQAVTAWGQGADKLTLYLVGGQGEGASFAINGTESLSPSVLQGWLNGLQTNGATEVVLVMDYPGAGGALPELVAPAGKRRVTIAGTRSGQRNIFANEGLVSFSNYFLSGVFSGLDVGAAFDNARTAVRQASGRLKQNPVLEDNGDGIANKYDGELAGVTFIGSAFLTGAESPTIGAVTPSGVISGAGGCALWASGVADMDGLSNVWCVITPPEYEGAGDLPQADLSWSGAGQRFEGAWGGFTNAGTYTLTFHAMDAQGEISAPVQSDVLLADPYEDDDVPAQAAFFDVGSVQAHNFHASNDVDWVRFYCVTGAVYEIEALQIGDSADLSLDLYRENPDGSLTAIETGIDVNWEGAGDGERATLNFVEDSSLLEGFYVLRVSSANPGLWGCFSDYEVRVWAPTGGGRLIVVAVDKLNPGLPPQGAWAEVAGVGTQLFGLATSVVFSDVPAGPQTVRVHAPAGYLAEEDPALPGQSANAANALYGNPKVKAIQDDVWQLAVFQFVPANSIGGRVIDRFTGEPVGGAGLAFRGVGGVLDGKLFDGYPSAATYKSPWVTGADGAFPTNVWLPTAQWNLTLSVAGYTNLVLDPAVASMPAGTTTNLGVLLLSPLDLNANGVADGWEAQFGLTNVTSGSDADGDASPDRSEYLSGTDPTNSLSVFQVLELIQSPAAECGLRWSASGLRNYRVYWSDSPAAWPAGQSVLVGPTNAWCDPADPKPAMRFYRVEVDLPR